MYVFSAVLIQAVEVKFLRGMMGRTKRDRIRNAGIREKEIRMHVKNQIERNRLSWFGQVKRMDKHRIPERVLDMKMSGKSPRGRP
jgi:hypothetical protein